MKKTLALATMATLLTAGAAFAAGSKHLVPTPNVSGVQGAYTVNPQPFVGGTIPAGGTLAAASGPTTTANDDSCDIGVTPAATLLLPYFEVDFKSPAGVATQTLFTITNTSDIPQIAKVTVWTDYSFPVLDFNIFLTGYGQQGINLYDVIARGIIAPGGNGGAGGTSINQPAGPFSVTAGRPAVNFNPNFNAAAAANCTALPGAIPPTLLTDVQNGLTVGTVSGCGSAKVGGTHANAIGYITVDVVANCTTTLPTSGTYYQNEILFDNVLIGDYAQLNPNPATANSSAGNTMVDIRAIPEGGAAGEVPVAGAAATNLPFTFYTRYVNNLPTPYAANSPLLFRDRRQPLPSTFAARFIQGGASSFNTSYKIWREGVEGTGSCRAVAANATIPITEIVRFDEHENPTTYVPGVIISPAVPQQVTLPETSNTPTSSSTFPGLSTSGDVGGWMYLNLDSGAAPFGTTEVNTAIHPTFPLPRPSQNWVIVNEQAQTRFSVDFNAAWLGNGCNPSAGTSLIDGGVNPVGPAGGVLVCPSGFTGTGCTAGTGLFTGGNGTP